MKKIVFSLLTAVLLLCTASCGAKKIEYSFEKAVDEHITDGEYNRDVSIFKIKTNSQHEEEINEVIYSVFKAKLDDYLDGAAIDWQHLVIDTTRAEKDDVLCITVIANMPHATYIAPVYSESIYLDLKKDTLYSFEEYAEKSGIDITKAKDEVALTYAADSFDFEGVFYRGDDIFLIVQIESLNENGVDTYSSAFYNYTTGEIIHGSSSHFLGFDSIE